MVEYDKIFNIIQPDNIYIILCQITRYKIIFSIVKHAQIGSSTHKIMFKA